MLAIFLIPASLAIVLGYMLGPPKHGSIVHAAPRRHLLGGNSDLYCAETQGNPACIASTRRSPAMQAGGNMEGRQVRFGITVRLPVTGLLSNSAGGDSSRHTAIRESFISVHPDTYRANVCSTWAAVSTASASETSRGNTSACPPRASLSSLAAWRASDYERSD